ncbi:bifunctional hydroxymethylpyrimidine kinase/phosphomethylpyrimidine kinase [Metallosphaera tengchongensis]|uniref:Bifunctional hydroxymethylpyrimidine kinase/phosphomethylpyrimidine kinase n=1 Tax=Metallosphaera tengchongensis TaxID=1532350 RepID=A0A6N0NVZ7_9CREN|nr:bifunctional hydroxymethylpyrimidine kinase/phosphomethylpyrimidine kinase [Metallosphaera tengchongensis]QKR01026.1 bifunctional hydroxymethylpyrimidine kinase/phosphomethylpyrimidine kinase [Metallosphaera tengchongensis]
MRVRPVALTIAGSDSGGGAGVQADLKTFTSLGVFGVSVITGITSQNTKRVGKILEMPPDMIESQFDLIMEDFPVKYGKTGMLSSTKVVDCVERKISQYKLDLVLDPVMISKSGYPLISEDTVRNLSRLIKKSILITPNKFEAERLTGFTIRTTEDLRKVAHHIYKNLGINVVVKGGKFLNGHDFAIINGDELELSGEGINTNNLHGSGDVFSAAITGYLSMGHNVKDAITKAKSFVTESIKYSLSLGGGSGPVDPFAPVERVIEINQARESLEKLVEYIEKNKDKIKKILSNDDKINVGYLTEYGDYATLAGGIIKYIEWIKVDGPIVVNWYTNTIFKALKLANKKIGISISIGDELLKVLEKKKLKISESGIYGDVILVDGVAVLVADTLNELEEKIGDVLS